MEAPEFLNEGDPKPKRKYVSEYQVECPVCKYRRTSIWEPTYCNHNQEEEATPTPMVKMVRIQ